MDRRIETRVVDTGGVMLTTLIQKDACEVWWIALSPQTPKTPGVLKIYDGFDVHGKLEFQIETDYAFSYNFIPPIPCDYGLTIYNDTLIASYTVGYRPKGWPREQK